VATDGEGNVLVSGSFLGTMNTGTTITGVGSMDIFVTKYTGSGSHVWSKSFGSSQIEEGTALAVDSSGAPVVAGRFSTPLSLDTTTISSSGAFDAFIAKLAK
jgi:hypothetical protein